MDTQTQHNTTQHNTHTHTHTPRERERDSIVSLPVLDVVDDVVGRRSLSVISNGVSWPSFNVI